MNMDRFLAISWCLCLGAISGGAIPRSLLYDYKGGEVSELLRGDDVSSPPLQLTTPVVLYGIPYESVFVSAISGRVLARKFSLIIAEAIAFDYVKGRGVATLNNDSFRREGYCSLCKRNVSYKTEFVFEKFRCETYFY